MVLLSVCFHFGLAAMGAAWMKWGHSPLLNITPVTTVDLVGFVPPQGQIVATDFNLHRVAHRRKADQLDTCAY